MGSNWQGGGSDRVGQPEFLQQLQAARARATPHQPGGVPRDLDDLTRMPELTDPVERMQAPTRTLARLTDGLPLPAHEAASWRQFVQTLMDSDNEALFQARAQERARAFQDQVLRRVLMQRALSYYRHAGRPAGDPRRNLRTAGMTPEAKMDVQMQKALAGEGAGRLVDLIALLQALKALYQSLHWTPGPGGSSFYADHQLYERLYDSVTEEVDALAEKVVGLTGVNLDAPTLTKMASIWAAAIGDAPESILRTERQLVEDMIPALLRTLKDKLGALSVGLENHLQGIADRHEGHVYLLAQRMGPPAGVSFTIMGPAGVDPPAGLAKGNALGGKYHRRVTGEDGTHKYFYSEDAYRKSPLAHVGGPEVMRDRIRLELQERLRMNPGARLDSLDMPARYPPDMVSDVWNELTLAKGPPPAMSVAAPAAAGNVVPQPRIPPSTRAQQRQEKQKVLDEMGVAPPKPDTVKGETFTLDLEKAEGERGGRVIGHTAGGRAIYAPAYAPQGKSPRGWEHDADAKAAQEHVARSGFSASEHREARDAHEKAAVAAKKAGNLTAEVAHSQVAGMHSAFAEDSSPPDGDNPALAKAGPFVGPRGGQWADAAHTIPWHMEGGHMLPNPNPTIAAASARGKEHGAQVARASGTKKPVLLNQLASGHWPEGSKGAEHTDGMDPEHRSAYVRAFAEGYNRVVSIAHKSVEDVEAWAKSLALDLDAADRADHAGMMRAFAEGLEKGRALQKADGGGRAGPFIGPRGGKWADPQHTIPWEEGGGGGGGTHVEVEGAKGKVKVPAKPSSAKEHVEAAKNLGLAGLGKMEDHHKAEAAKDGPHKEFHGKMAQAYGELTEPDSASSGKERMEAFTSAVHAAHGEKAPEKAEPKKDVPEKAKERKWLDLDEHKKLGLPEDTQKHHQRDGQYTPQRKALHDTIKKKFLDHVPSVPEGKKPTAIVMMGGSGAGKGTVLRHIMGGVHDYVNVNSDDVKEELPEYKQAINLGGGRSSRHAAASVHEESSDVAKDIHKEAMAARKNLVLDGTGKNADKFAATIEDMKAKGYHVRLFMPHIDAEDARQRVKERADRSGRYVPDHFVEEAHAVIPGNFEKIAAHAHEAVLFDNSKPPPRPVMTMAAGQEPKVMDHQFVDKFREVGKAGHEKARARGWMKAWMEVMDLMKAQQPEPKKDDMAPEHTLEEFLERFKIDRGEAPDTATDIEDSEDVKRHRENTHHAGHQLGIHKAGGLSAWLKAFGDPVDPDEMREKREEAAENADPDAEPAEDDGDGDEDETEKSVAAAAAGPTPDESVQTAKDGHRPEDQVGMYTGASEARKADVPAAQAAAAPAPRPPPAVPGGAPDVAPPLVGMMKAMRTFGRAQAAAELEKAAVYTGPKGGKWADPEHKHAYREEKPAAAGGGGKGKKVDHPPIKLATPGGEPLEAKPHHVAGVYAAHKDATGSGYSVTHVPSGLSISSGKKKAEAAALADHLHKHAPDAGKDVPHGGKGWDKKDPASDAMVRALIAHNKAGGPTDDIPPPENREKQVLGKTAGGKDVVHAKGVDPNAPGNLWSRRSVTDAHPGWAAKDHLEAFQHLSQEAEKAKGSDDAKAGQLNAQAEAHNAVHERLTGKSAKTAMLEAERKKQADEATARNNALKESNSGQMGQTASGKPIHGAPDHEAHKDFTPQEHLEAADMHRRKAGPGYAGFDRTEAQHAERAYHHAAADAHAKMGRAKLDASKAAPTQAPPALSPGRGADAVALSRANRAYAKDRLASEGGGAKPAAPAAGGGKQGPTVKVATRGGSTDVEVHHQAGNYAVHPTTNGDGLTVTHVPSGMALRSFKDQKTAVGYANHMHEKAGDAGANIPFGKAGKEHKAELGQIEAAHKAFKG